MKRFALAGNPNCGKTTLFNSLTGSTAHVGNWPGVTAEKKVGTFKKCPEPIEIIDLPGIYSLSPYSPEEIITRNYIMEEKPDCVINIVDATNLERNLYLTTQLMEMDVPIIIALNMTDVLDKNGDIINIDKLSKTIGLPVVSVSALKEKGLGELMNKAYEIASLARKGVNVVSRDMPKDSIFGDDYEAFAADSRYQYITDNFSDVIIKKNKNREKLTGSDKIDKVLTHRVFGIPIFLGILFLVFHLTFSENFLFLGGLFKDGFVTLEGTFFEGVLGEGGINSPGVILQSLMGVLTDGFIGLVGGWLSSAPAWVSGLICDGVLGGLAAVLSFIPQILLLLMFFSILEDSGYMARVAFILDRIFRRFGLSGRAFMPMIMGFGCSIPAMINTRTLANESERTATIRVIPFFSCGAKLPILTAIAGAIVMQFGVGNADIITYGMYLLGIATAIIAIILMRQTTMKGEVAPFIMELPSYHAPQFKNLMLHLWDKAKHFFKKAFTIILASTIVIWFISHFSFSWQYLSDGQMNDSILAGIGQLVQPLFTPLGFGSQLGRFGWVFVVAAVTGLIAKENVIATLGALAASIVAGFEGGEEGVEAVVTLIQATGITLPALIAFIAFNMTTIPCFAAVATAKAEMGSKRKFNFTVLFWIVTSFIVASIVYIVGSWWWTAFIVVAAVIAAIGIIMAVNKKKRTT